MLSRIRKDDLVEVTSGKDKGKQGSVINIDSKTEKVLVKGVGMVTRHLKAKRQGETSKIIKEENYLPLCKVVPVCPSCKKTCRIKSKLLDDGKKVRSCHRCGEGF